MKKILTVFIMLLMPALLNASSSVGTTAVPFLKYGAGARAAGMGSAFSSVTGGGSDMIYWNPAGIASMYRKEVTLMYLSGFEGISYGWASYAIPTIYGVLGAAVQYMSSGDMEGTGTVGESESDFSTYDYAVSLSYARYAVFDGYGVLDYGANLKYIYSKIDNSASAFAVDGGAIFTLNDEVTSLGAVFQNLGTSLKYNEEEENLPFVFKASASRILFEDLLLVFDINFPNDNDIFPSFGAEYKIKIIADTDIALRAGYDGRQKDIDGFSGLNAGFGLNYKDYIFDYAFSPYGVLGNIHRVSLGILFGAEFDAEAAIAKKEEKKKLKEIESAKRQQDKDMKQRLKPAPQSGRYDSAAQSSQIDEKSDYAAKPASETSPEYDGQGYEEYTNISDIKRNEAARVTAVAVVDFIADNIPANEAAIFSEMLRKQLYGTGSFSVTDNSALKQIYQGKIMPGSGDISNIIKSAKVKKVITAKVSKTGSSLQFDLTVYDSKLSASKYSITSKDSFRFADEALKKFAGQLADEIK